MLYMVTLTINIPQMLAYIPYMDPMGMVVSKNDATPSSLDALFHGTSNSNG